MKILTLVVGLGGMELQSACTGSASEEPSAGPAAGGVASGSAPSAPTPVPFERVSVPAYLGKVKNLLTGLPPTADELSQMQADASKLPALIDTWMATDNFRQKQIRFFRNAFQQGNLSNTSFDMMAADGFGMNNRIPIYQNAMDSFPLTAWWIVSQNRPFNQVVTTDTFMVTPALLSTILYFDSRSPDDQQNIVGFDYQQGVRYEIVHDNYPDGTTINPAYSVSQTPNKWYTSCATAAFHADPQGLDDYGGLLLNRYLWGQVLPCTDALPVVFSSADWTTWRPVQFVQAQGSQAHSRMYDFATLRTASQVVTASEKVGFFTTLAFFANWPTNISNQGRGVTNQTLIVALGGSFSPSDTGVPLTTSTLSPDHAAVGTQCFSCHQRLDPMRAFFRRAYTLNFGKQIDNGVNASDPKAIIWSKAQAGFSYGGVNTLGTSLHDLGQILATHPDFATAWTQKLCIYANSVPCDPTDPEFVRVAAGFAASQFNYKTLVRTLFSSPLVTGAAPTQTAAAAAQPVSISRGNHLCDALRLRLNLEVDPCGHDQDINTQLTSLAFQIGANVPSDGYGRGQVQGTPATGASLFTRASSEALCEQVAGMVVDNMQPLTHASPYGNDFGFAPLGPRVVFSSATPQTSIASMVTTVMGIPGSDSRYASLVGMLQDHFAAASATAGATPHDAMASTFTLACLSPTSVLVGL